MGLKEKINDNLKSSMKSGDKVRLSTIRSIRALILEFEKSGAGRELSPEDELNLLSSAAKKRKESIEQFEKGGRIELVDQEKHELEIINEFLPKQLSDEELFDEIKKIAHEVGASSKADFAKLMPVAAKSFKGKADGKKVKEMVDKLLSGN
ncbi:MAG: GatB/YqeY domain-containing protein [Bacteroidetes bacterium]|nr:GatB/YqeY domain-containing protein [Bacteroidota bacterium]MBU2507913.1 GatB/YqeY domain-containing protein [Bacteroidota bacterium]